MCSLVQWTTSSLVQSCRCGLPFINKSVAEGRERKFPLLHWDGTQTGHQSVWKRRTRLRAAGPQRQQSRQLSGTEAVSMDYLPAFLFFVRLFF